MNTEKDDLLSAFEHLNRNRNIKLFDYYQEWFINKNYLSFDIIRKIKVDLGISVNRSSVHYIRSKIMPRRLQELKNSAENIPLKQNITIEKNESKSSNNLTNDFAFKEPKSIDHSQEIVTIRKSTHETN